MKNHYKFYKFVGASKVSLHLSLILKYCLHCFVVELANVPHLFEQPFSAVCL